MVVCGEELAVLCDVVYGFYWWAAHIWLAVVVCFVGVGARGAILLLRREYVPSFTFQTAWFSCQ